MEQKQAKFGPGTTFRPIGSRTSVPCKVVDVLTTYNLAGEVVKIRYVATHEFMGQTVTDHDVCETTIARGLVEKKDFASANCNELIILARVVEKFRPRSTATFPQPEAMVWSSDVSELQEAREYGERHGYKVMVLPDTPDVLKVARDKVCKESIPTEDTKKTEVIFRKFKEGDIIAIFPGLPGTNNYLFDCLCYQHLGQHSAVSVDIISTTKPATEAEYEALARELAQIGYNLEVVDGFSPKHAKIRENAVHRI